MKRYFNNKGRIILGSLLLALSLTVALYLILPDKAGSGVYLDSFHGNATSGVNRTTAFAIGFCAQCHNPHTASGGPFGYNLFASRANNAICFTTGCHDATILTGYPAQEGDRMPSTATYPYYFEKNTSGTRTTGLPNRVRWPGSNAYIDTGVAGTKDYSPHYKDTNMPLQDATGQGLCANCHNNPHKKGTYPYDMLRNTYIGPGPITNFNLCFSVPSDGTLYPAATCHDTGGVPDILANEYIKGFYDSAINADAQAGHQINCSSKSVSNVAACQTAFPNWATNTDHKMPCYNCHNPHGSIGSDKTGGANRNAYLISDQRAGYWYGIINPLGTTQAEWDQNRRFCFGCHVPSGGTAGSIIVMGISMNTIPTMTVHTNVTLQPSCYSCHGGSYASTTAKNVHHPDPGGSCISCHNSAAGAPRRNLSTASELTNLAWGHKKTAAGVWNNNDCGVCHMEGDPATGSPTGLHKDGIFQFRDADTGTTIMGVTFSGTPGSYVSTATAATSTTFARNTGTGGQVLEAFAQAVMINMCLNCHDADGAKGTNGAGAGVVVPGGSALKPFNTSPTHTPGNNVLDVKTHFTTTYASYHPIRGRQNNSYADANTMAVPWNTAGSPGGTKTTKTSLTNWGWLITCWDCHDSSATARTIGGANASSTAHGAASTLRAVYDNEASGVATPLCAICHLSSVYWTFLGHGTADLGKVTDNWSAGKSALDDWGAVPNVYHAVGEGHYFGCTVCHGTTTGAGGRPSRPLRAENAHGFNTLSDGTTTSWSASATAGGQATRPFSFMRTTNLDFWNIGTGTGTARGICSSTTKVMCAKGYAYTYGPAGTY